MEKLGISDELRSCHAGHDRSHLKYRIMLSNAWQTPVDSAFSGISGEHSLA
jgi:hypothetical protein